MDRRDFVKATGIAALSAGASPAAGTSETDAGTPAAAGERRERNEAPSGGARQHSYYANVTRW